jgi:hypothetical protein
VYEIFIGMPIRRHCYSALMPKHTFPPMSRNSDYWPLGHAALCDQSFERIFPCRAADPPPNHRFAFVFGLTCELVTLKVLPIPAAQAAPPVHGDGSSGAEHERAIHQAAQAGGGRRRRSKNMPYSLRCPWSVSLRYQLRKKGPT